MIHDFNLLVTTSRGNERYTISELSYLLGHIGDSTPTIGRTGVSGLLAVRSSIDPLQVIEKLREILNERPYEFRYTLRVIPVEKVVHTNLDEIEQTVEELSPKIQKKRTFRITVEKRFTNLSSKEIIETVAAKVKRKVNLKKPNWVILIEVVGGFTGVSILKPSSVLSILKEKVL